MVTSRLAQREQKKVMKQTMIIAGAAVVLFLLFLFVVLPQMVRFAANVLDGGSIGEPEDTIPPQVPIISSPVDATFSAQLPLKGVGEPKSQVVLLVNSQEMERVTIDDAGDFSLEVPLTVGENAITLYSVDEAENESVKSQTYSVILDTEDPVITVEQPQNGQTIELRKNQVTEVKGTTEPNAQVHINDRLTYANASGQFNYRYQLQEGENKLLIKAIDKAGNTADTELTVMFRF